MSSKGRYDGDISAVSKGLGSIVEYNEDDWHKLEKVIPQLVHSHSISDRAFVLCNISAVAQAVRKAPRSPDAVSCSNAPVKHKGGAMNRPGGGARSTRSYLS